ncbi:MAG TPA: LptA/OstA family protein [Candidatus Acidoferrum sp.]|jgi:lipopolysaccharide export system protein LptA
MKRSEAARYARWSALVAIVLAASTGAVYLKRQYTAHVEKKNAPPAPPRDVERQSSGITFSKGDGTRTIFTVQASKSTDFKGQDASLLEDVHITVFGKNGDRHDVIHTQSCQYAKADGGVQCNGEVQMELQSAADAERLRQQSSGVPNIVRVETRGVTFEKATGRAQTVQPVKFTFPNGSGEGVGAVYSSEEGQLRLIRDVHLKMDASSVSKGAAKRNTAASEVDIQGSSLEFGKTTHSILLYGPVTATTSAQQLTAGELFVSLDPAFRARSLIARPGTLGQTPEVVSRGAGGGSTKFHADQLTAELSPEGWVTTVLADGNVDGIAPTGGLQAERGELEMWPRVNQAKLLTLRGNVRLQSRDPKTGLQRNVKTEALQLNFTGGQLGQPNRLQHSETLARGTIEWNDAAASRSKLTADKLALDFGATGKAQQLVATGAVQTERELKDKPLQTASSTNGLIQMEPTGEWSRITMQGNVHLKEGDRSGEAQQAVFTKANQTAVLTGKALARDATSETHAAKITFNQATGEIFAEGDVRSTDLSAKTTTVQLAPVPTNLSSEHMEANSKTGRALYTGHARMWQGASVLEAESIELLRDTRVVNAVGTVRAVFPQASNDQSQPKKQPSLWHISAGTVSYWDLENRAKLEDNVVVQSVDQRMRAPVLDLFFTRAPAGKQGVPGGAQISRAVGTGGVMVEEGDRRATAEKGVYTAEDQKFVLSGGNPTVYDDQEGTTTGRQLTFHIADGTIVVDSGEGLRTLTKHRVQ